MSAVAQVVDDVAAPSVVSWIEDIDPDALEAYGGKAVGLARMAANGIPIPPAFVISTDGYHMFRREGRVPAAMAREVKEAVGALARATGRAFATGTIPILVSVRSGAAISMPGMMDTILNLGLDARSALALSEETGNPTFVVDSWTRFWGMYAETVLGLDAEAVLDAIAGEREAAEEHPSAESFAALERAIIAAIEAEGEDVSADPNDHLIETVAAVFRSWDSRRAKTYRKHHNIPDDMGTAVTVQSMVFGNMDRNSGTGVAFTRDPNNGEKTLYGEYLVGHQGEDLVAGTHTPIKLSDAAMPAEISAALARHGKTLERIYKDAVDIEFTVQSGTLYFLQVRAAKRTALAAIRIALDQMDDGLINTAAAMRRVTTDQIAKMMRPRFEPDALTRANVLARGLGSSPGQAVGAVYLDSDVATERAEAGEDVILLRPVTSPQDIRGMLAANGIVTARGGALSHAAVVSRALDKPCIVGCEDIEIDLGSRTFTVNGTVFPEGSEVSIDGADGQVWQGAIPIVAAGTSDEALRRFLAVARRVSGVDLWHAPHTDAEAARAVESEAHGIGLASLSDMIIAAGRMDAFTEGVAELTRGDATREVLDATAEIVRRSCLPLFEAVGERPVHLRLPQLRSERARDLVANWEDIPPSQFLPLGSLDLNRAMLSGVASARKAVGGRQVVIFAGGLTDVVEFHAFAAALGDHEGLDAGLLVQNTVMLFRLARSPEADVPIWIDVNEIIRTAHGYANHVLQMPSILDDYCSQGLALANPLRDTEGILAEPLRSIGAAGGNGIGVTGAGAVSDELLELLYKSGFRRFSAQAATADLVGVRLARLFKE